MDELEVARLLEASRAAHLEYRSNVARSAPGGVKIPGNVLGASAALATAAALRKQANDLDPDHVAAAWVLDEEFTGGAHALETWYAEHLGRTDDPVAVAAATVLEAQDVARKAAADAVARKVADLTPADQGGLK